MIEEYKAQLPALEQKARAEVKMTSRQWKDQRLEAYIRSHEKYTGEKITKHEKAKKALHTEEDYQKRRTGYDSILNGLVRVLKSDIEAKAREQGIEDFQLP